MEKGHAEMRTEDHAGNPDITSKLDSKALGQSLEKSANPTPTTNIDAKSTRPKF
jgi:hypothetical protein